jgi:protein disulfide-isomerase
MRRLLVPFVFAFPLAAQEPTWLTDFEAAKAAAKQEGKVILADFTGSDWCGWCIKLKDEVFSKPEFAEWAKQKVVLLELDFPKKTQLPAELAAQNQRLKKEYGIKGYPTILFLDADGKQLGQYGYDKGGPANWIKQAEAKMTPAAEGEWLTNFEAALAKAKKEKKVVLADFTGSDWCGWCIRLKDEVFSKPEFQAWAKEHVVLLEVDFPRKKQLPEDLQKQNKKLQQEYKIEGYPTIVFLDAKGKDIGRSGYVEGGPAAWIAAAEKELGIKSKGKKK